MTTADVELTAAPNPGHTLARAQFALAGLYATAIGVALGRAAAFSGHLYLPHQGDEYTATAYLWPGLWAPVSLALILVIGATPYVTAVTALVAVTRLATAGMRASAHRRSLLVSTVLAALVAASSLTPAVRTLLGWLLD